MANTFTITGNATLALDGSRLVGSMAQTVTLTGSNAEYQSLNVNNSTWTPLVTSSLSDYRYGWFFNNLQTSASVIGIATGSAGQNPLATLNPDDSFLLPGSGSVIPLYAKVLSGATPAVLQYILAES